MQSDLLDLTVITAPTAEPVTLAEAKAHLRVTHTAEDLLIAAHIVVAREEAERVTRRALMRQTLELRLTAWPQLLYLPRPPLATVVSIKYTTDANVTYTLPEAAYAVNSGTEPGHIYFNPDYRPSDTLAAMAPIAVRYTAGWASASSVPQGIKAAMLLMIADLYTNRIPGDVKRTTAAQMLINKRVEWEAWIQ